MNCDETREFWNRTASDWDIQVGDNGDSNRILNSDPVLWQFAGDVSGLDVLDAGCGTGYLSHKLYCCGARVIGIDFSAEMCRIAKAKWTDIDFRVDSCSTLSTIEDSSMDIVISNYVLMDTPDLEGSTFAFHRVLRRGGVVIAIFSHPCFPQGRARKKSDDMTTEYCWEFSYFERRKCVDPPWRHFKSEFIWFHRPLSDYWKAFVAAGFDVIDFEEPRLTKERYHLAENDGQLLSSTTRPYSAAFKLRKR